MSGRSGQRKRKREADTRSESFHTVELSEMEFLAIIIANGFTEFFARVLWETRPRHLPLTAAVCVDVIMNSRDLGSWIESLRKLWQQDDPSLSNEDIIKLIASKIMDERATVPLPKRRM